MAWILRNSSNQRYNQTNLLRDSILLASHLLDEVEKVCSHVLVLKKRGHFILVQLMACQQMRDSSNYKRMTQQDDRSFKNTSAVETIKQEEGKVLFI
jgi:ABC-type uncharacterized transport system ATPase subunit